MNIIEIIQQPWPWYVSGSLLAVVMFLLLYFGKRFGLSSNLDTVCAAMGAGRSSSYFRFDWKQQYWNLVFIIGALIGGWISSNFLVSGEAVQISSKTIRDLQSLGINYDDQLLPLQLFSWSFVTTRQGVLLFVVGGFMVGFGARLAGGCTSGHAISGLSNLQLPSLVAVIGFFIGGLIITHLVYPILF